MDETKELQPENTDNGGIVAGLGDRPWQLEREAQIRDNKQTENTAEHTRFFLLDGSPISNLVGQRRSIVQINQRPSNESEIYIYPNGQAARDRAAEARVCITRTSEESRSLETRSFFKANSKTPVATVLKEIDQKSNTVTITAITPTERQTIVFANGGVTQLQFEINNGERMTCTFDAKGSLQSLERNGTVLDSEQSRIYMGAIQRTIAIAKKENELDFANGPQETEEKEEGEEDRPEANEAPPSAQIEDDVSFRKEYKKETIDALHATLGSAVEGQPIDPFSQLEFFSDIDVNPRSPEGRNAKHIRDFMKAIDPAMRQKALDGLAKEVLSGDNYYAISVLKRLSLVHAACRLKEAKTADQRNDAFKALASIELSSFESRGRNAFLAGLPETMKDFRKNEASLAKPQREARLNARIALSSRVNADQDLDTSIVNFVNAIPEDRKKALAVLEERAIQSCVLGDNDVVCQTRSEVFRARFFDSALDITETTDAKTALASFDKIESEAKEGNIYSNSFLKKVPQGDLNRIKKDLASADKDVSSKALIELKQVLGPQQQEFANLRQKNPAELIESFADRPEEISRARLQAQLELTQAEQKVEIAMAQYLDRSATTDQRLKALGDLKAESGKRIRHHASDNVEPLVSALERIEQGRKLKADLLNALRQVDGSAKTTEEHLKIVKDELRALLGEAEIRGESSIFGKDRKYFERKLSDLDDPARTCAVLKELLDALPRTDRELDQLRVGTIGNSLNREASDHDYARAEEELKEEAEKFGNTAARELLPWVQATRVMKNIERTGTTLGLLQGISELGKMAHAGNYHARRALASLLVSDAEASDKYEFRRTVDLTSGNRATSLAVAIPDLSNLADKYPEAFKACFKQLIGTIMTLPRTTETDASAVETAALAMTLIRKKNQSGTHTLDSELIENVHNALKEQVEKCPRAFGALCSLLSSSDKKEREILIDAVIVGAKKFGIESLLTQLQAGAAKNDSVSIKILARIAAGHAENGEKADAASAILDRAAAQDSKACTLVQSILIECLKTSQDRGVLLATLGAVTARSGNATPEVRAILHTGLRNDDTRSSAAIGLSKMARLWDNSDVEALNANMSAAVLSALESNRYCISDSHQRSLVSSAFEVIISKPVDKSGKDAQDRVTALRLLTVFSGHIQPHHIPSIAALGDRFSPGQAFEGASAKLESVPAIGKVGLREKGFTDDQAKAIQVEASKVLVSTVLTSKDPDAKDLATRAIASHSFAWSLEDSQLRSKILDFGQGKEISLDDLDRITSILYGIRRPTAALLRDLRSGYKDSEYFERAESAARKYDVAAVVANMHLWNSLPPEIRKALLASTPELSSAFVDPAQVEGLLVAGTLEEKFPFLRDEFYHKNVQGEHGWQLQGRTLRNAVETLESVGRKSIANDQYFINNLKADYDKTLAELVKLTSEGKTGAFFSFGAVPTHLKMLAGAVLPRSPIDLNGNVDLTALIPGSRSTKVLLEFRSKWDTQQKHLLEKLDAIETDIIAREKVLNQKQKLANDLALAVGIGKYHEAANSGDLKKADAEALNLIRDFGVDRLRVFAPEIHNSLFGNEQAGFQRLKLNGRNSLGRFPEYSSDMSKRLDQGVEALRGWKDGGKVEAAAFRRSALEAIECDPGLNDIADIARTVGADLEVFYDLFEAGSVGSKGPNFVKTMREYAKQLADQFAAATPEKIARCRASLNRLEAALPHIADKEAYEALENKISSLKAFMDIASSESQSGKQFRKLLAEIQDSTKFSEDTIGKWFRENGPNILAGAVAAAITVVSLGSGTPVAVTLVAMAASGVVGTQLTKELLFQVDNKVFGVVLGHPGERSLPMKWFRENETKLMVLFALLVSEDQLSSPQMEKLRNDLIASFTKEMALPLGEEFLTNVVLGFGCFGAGQVGANGFRSLFTKSTLNNLFRSRVTQDFAAATKAVTDAAAKSKWANSFVVSSMKGVAKESKNGLVFVGKAESLTAVSDEVAHKWVGAHNQYLAFISTLAVAFSQGKHHRPVRPGRGSEVFVDPAALKEVIAALRKDGHTVKAIPGKPGEWEVTTYNNRGDAPPLIMRLSPETAGKLPHEVPAKKLPGVKSDSLGKDGKWMTASAGEMSKGNYKGAYEAARNNEMKPPDLEIVPEVVEITAADIMAGKVGDHISSMRGAGRAGADQNGKLQITEPRTLIKLPDGVTVDLLNPTVTAGANSKSLTPSQKQIIDRCLESPHGKRILAEHAFIIFEEMFHIRQLVEGGIPLSDLYKGFAASRPGETTGRNNSSDIFGRNRDSYEREFLVAAYEAGIVPEVLDAQFAKMYGARAEMMDFVNKVANKQISIPEAGKLPEQLQRPVEPKPVDPTKPAANKPGETLPVVAKPGEVKPNPKVDLRRIEEPKPDSDPWKVRPLDPTTLRPTDPASAKWLDKALERLDLSPEELAVFNEGLANGKIRFTILDRSALVALEKDQRILSLEGGKEVNSAPYKPGAGQDMKTPLQHADLYDPATWPAATLMVRVPGPHGDKYYVVNGCRRVHVFGSEALNPKNKSIPILVFDGPEAFLKALNYDTSAGINRATPFNFMQNNSARPARQKVELRRIEDNIETSLAMIKEAQKPGKALDSARADSHPETAQTMTKALTEQVNSKKLTTEHVQKLLTLPPGDLDTVTTWLTDSKTSEQTKAKFLSLSPGEMDAFLTFKRSDILPLFEEGSLDGQRLLQLQRLVLMDSASGPKAAKAVLKNMKDWSPLDTKALFELLPQLEVLPPAALLVVLQHLPVSRFQNLSAIAKDPARLADFVRQLDGVNALSNTEIHQRKESIERSRDKLTEQAENSPSDIEMASKVQDVMSVYAVLNGLHRSRVAKEVSRLKSVEQQTSADTQVTSRGGFATQGLVTKWVRDLVAAKNKGTDPARYILLEGRPGSGADHVHMDVILLDTHSGRYVPIDIKQKQANLPDTVKLLQSDPRDPRLDGFEHGSLEWTAARKALVESDMANIFSGLRSSPLNIMTVGVPLEVHLSPSNLGKTDAVLHSISILPPALKIAAATRMLGEVQKQQQSVETFVKDLRAEANRAPGSANRLRSYALEIENRLLRKDGFFARTTNQLARMSAGK